MGSYNYRRQVPSCVHCRQQRYTATNPFSINGFSEANTIYIDSGETPLIHPKYYVHNVGRTQVFAELLFGKKSTWLGFVGAQVVIPGQTAEFPIEKPYYVTAMKIYNNTPSRAMVHVWAGNINLNDDRVPDRFEAILNRLYREVFSMGIKTVNLSFSGIVATFWPNNEPNIWQLFLNRMGVLLDKKAVDVITRVINDIVENYHERIRTLAEQTNVNPSSGFKYMRLAEDLLGFDLRFTFTQATADYQYTNYILLPLFSHAVHLSVLYYSTCIVRAQEFMLTIEEVDTIRGHAKQVISIATKYINDMYVERIDSGYETFFAEDIYNNMMNVRTYIAVHGLEYFAIWKKILEEPHSETPVYNSVISYSQFFGMKTGELNREATVMILREPLTPLILPNGIRRRLTCVEVYMWRMYGVRATKIGGLRLTFCDNTTREMGTKSDEINILNFGEDLLKKLKVYGRECIDKLEFYMSDGRILGFGTDISDGICNVFEMKNHYIASIFLSSDKRTQEGPAANVAVSFLPL